MIAKLRTVRATLLAALMLGLLAGSPEALGQTASDRILDTMRAETAARAQVFNSRLDLDKVTDPLAVVELAKGLDIEAVRRQMRTYQADNAAFQDFFNKRPDVYRERLLAAGLSRSDTAQLVEAYKGGLARSGAAEAFTLRHELADAVLQAAEFLHARRGAWKIVNSTPTFDAPDDLQRYKALIDRVKMILRELE